MKHAKLSPSSAYRWIKCPVSIKLSSYFPADSKEEDYLSEGRRAHALAEWELKKLTHQDSKEIDFEIEPDMHEYVKSYVNYITSECGEGYERLEVEKAVDLNWLEDKLEIYGTADCIVYSENKIDVFDFKYGLNYLVEDDTQLKIYALGALGESDAKYITTHVYQPRRGHILKNEYTREELVGWYKSVVYPAGYRSLYQPFLAVPGSWCKFCAGRGYCKENELELDDFRIDTPISQLSLDEMSKNYQKLEKLERYKKDLKEAIENELKQGHTVPGYVLKPSRGRRIWKDIEKVLKTSKELGIQGEPLSPNKMQKKLGKKKFDELFSDCVELKGGRETVQKDSK